MSIPKVFEQPLSLWEPLLGNESLWGALANPFRTQDGTGDMAFLPPCDITEEKNIGVIFSLNSRDKATYAKIYRCQCTDKPKT